MCTGVNPEPAWLTRATPTIPGGLAYTRCCFVPGLLCKDQGYSLHTHPLFTPPPSPPVIAHTFAQYNVPPRPPVIAIYTIHDWRWQYCVKAKSGEATLSYSRIWLSFGLTKHGLTRDGLTLNPAPHFLCRYVMTRERRFIAPPVEYRRGGAMDSWFIHSSIHLFI